MRGKILPLETNSGQISLAADPSLCVHYRGYEQYPLTLAACNATDVWRHTDDAKIVYVPTGECMDLSGFSVLAVM